MVTEVNHRGFRDWLIQRVTAILVGLYVIVLFVYLLSHQNVTFFEWQSFFNHIAMKLFTLIVLLSIFWHAWIGLWTVFTDYVKNKSVRFILEILVCLLLLAFLVWTLEILWVAG